MDVKCVHYRKQKFLKDSDKLAINNNVVSLVEYCHRTNRISPKCAACKLKIIKNENDG